MTVDYGKDFKQAKICRLLKAKLVERQRFMSGIWEQRGTLKLPVRWRLHDNKLHLLEDLICEANLTLR